MREEIFVQFTFKVFIFNLIMAIEIDHKKNFIRLSPIGNKLVPTNQVFVIFEGNEFVFVNSTDARLYCQTKKGVSHLQK